MPTRPVAYGSDDDARQLTDAETGSTAVFEPEGSDADLDKPLFAPHFLDARPASCVTR